MTKNTFFIRLLFIFLLAALAIDKLLFNPCEQGERPAATAVLLRLADRSDPVQRVIVVIVQLRDDIAAAAQRHVVDLAQHVAVVVHAVGKGIPTVSSGRPIIVNQRASAPIPFVGRTVADANVHQLLPVVVMQVVIERAGLHPESLAAHQARRCVGDARGVIAASSVAQGAGEAGQLRGSL